MLLNAGAGGAAGGLVGGAMNAAISGGNFWQGGAMGAIIGAGTAMASCTIGYGAKRLDNQSGEVLLRSVYFQASGSNTISTSQRPPNSRNGAEPRSIQRTAIGRGSASFGIFSSLRLQYHIHWPEATK